MKLIDLQHKQVAIVGFGKEGHAMLAAMQTTVPTAKVTICDQNTEIFVPNTKLQTGADWLQNLEAFDVLIVSPGVPPQPELDVVATKVTTSMQFVLDEAHAMGCMTIGVTGSKGKSTVSSLLAYVLKSTYTDVRLIGNIGTPGISVVPTLTPQTILVCELSSYQLLRMNVSPRIAVITSFFPDHLPYHANETAVRAIVNPAVKQAAALQSYMQAKMNLTKFQHTTDTVFYDTYTEGAKKIANKSSGIQIATSEKNCLVNLAATKLIGAHNLRNIGLVTAVAQHLQVPTLAIKHACQTFVGLPHRLQTIVTHDGNRWIDDAISTTPESTIAALEALQGKVDILIAGGQDRGSIFLELAKKILTSSIHTIILFPESGMRIQAAIKKVQPTSTIQFFAAASMPEAVQHCKNVITKQIKPQIILLSTASASYGLFANFEEKGKQFAECI